MRDIFFASVVTFNQILSHMTLNVTLTLRLYRSPVPIIILKLRSLQTNVTLKLRRYSSLIVNVALMKKRYRSRQLNVTLKLISKLWEALVKALGIPMTLLSYWPIQKVTFFLIIDKKGDWFTKYKRSHKLAQSYQQRLLLSPLIFSNNL